MVRKKDPFPSEGDLVICTVSKISGHGAFVRLDEYAGRDGFIHISEVASIWVKNIRDYVREGQKTVAKVLSVDPQKGHIDLSVRRVGEAQKAAKTQEWKREQKAEKLLELVAKELNKTLNEAYEHIGFPLEEKYGGLYLGLEEILLEGENALEDISPEWKTVLLRTVKENIVLPTVEIDGFIELRINDGDGVVKIRQALAESLKIPVPPEIKLEIRYLSPPRYRVHVKAPDYKSAEEALKTAAEKAVAYINAKGGTGKYLREAK